MTYLIYFQAMLIGQKTWPQEAEAALSFMHRLYNLENYFLRKYMSGLKYFPVYNDLIGDLSVSSSYFNLTKEKQHRFILPCCNGAKLVLLGLMFYLT